MVAGEEWRSVLQATRTLTTPHSFEEPASPGSVTPKGTHRAGILSALGAQEAGRWPGVSILTQETSSKDTERGRMPAGGPLEWKRHPGHTQNLPGAPEMSGGSLEEGIRSWARGLP